MVSNTASMGPATDSPAHGTSTAIVVTGISHVLLDIEGTTCPVSFVAETLFPYARQRLDSYLREHQQDPAIRVLLDDVARSWALEQTSAVSGLGGTVADGGVESGGSSDPGAPTLRQLVDFLASLIDQDRKLTALKELQGLIWEEGYGNGSLQAPLFDDVPQALRAWVATGLRLAVYSSGSVAAQQLLYGHSKAGDLRPLFSDWFDTHVGPKQDPASYLRIAASLRARPSAMLFLSDSRAELEAASQAGLNVLFSHRLGNPEVSSGPYTAFTSLQDIAITPAAD
jgi:enolase-phosphatase E1